MGIVHVALPVSYGTCVTSVRKDDFQRVRLNHLPDRTLYTPDALNTTVFGAVHEQSARLASISGSSANVQPN
jgi:hypothetical protein